MKTPAYQQIYQSIRERIREGNYMPGARLPGKRVLAEQNGVSVITAARALEMLEDEGYVIARERSGYFVADPADVTVIRPAAKENEESFRTEVLSSADMDGFPFSVLAGTMRRVISEKGEAILVKSPNQGLYTLRKALAGYLSRERAMDVRPEQIVIGAGAEYLYGLIVNMLGKEGGWAIEDPSYEKIEKVYRLQGIEPEKLRMAADGIRSGDLKKTKAKVLHVCPYRSYPSDISASAEKKEEYLRWAAQGERWIVEDDYESEFDVRRKPMETLFSRTRNENVIYLNTFSRTISPAVRVGYMVIPEGLIERYQERIGFYSCAVPAFEQYVLAELLDRGDLERHIHRVRRKLRNKL